MGKKILTRLNSTVPTNMKKELYLQIIASVIEKLFLKILRIRAKKGKKPNPKPQNWLHLPADLPPSIA